MAYTKRTTQILRGKVEWRMKHLFYKVVSELVPGEREVCGEAEESNEGIVGVYVEVGLGKEG